MLGAHSKARGELWQERRVEQLCRSQGFWNLEFRMGADAGQSGFVGLAKLPLVPCQGIKILFFLDFRKLQGK